ncbi:hypothetical protein CLHUN_42010 [Ruminiclostridium hungatei]|uniref:Uncharacterized protein n=1 Tax=Ruminiclostridium hungatei TaxID=48256 RepID=A0A1V4SFC0_RUMHU|nr:Imm7 family immunity protein [Ruminiclostridium hungatei]OPX41941.1 hypothetical protein CLHUN_42010 [Ruminiclostridium hungatei]
MVELHGWALIRENFTTDNEDVNLEQIINHLVQEIEKLDIDKTLLQIVYSNGEASLTATKFTNHFSDDIKNIVGLFERIATLAPGSYGLLYLRNDEDTDGFNNAFQVFVLSRGILKLQQDPFLSPYCPTVEDED